jgi:hypothetical protein
MSGGFAGVCDSEIPLTLPLLTQWAPPSPAKAGEGPKAMPENPLAHEVGEGGARIAGG